MTIEARVGPPFRFLVRAAMGTGSLKRAGYRSQKVGGVQIFIAEEIMCAFADRGHRRVAVLSVAEQNHGRLRRVLLQMTQSRKTLTIGKKKLGKDKIELLILN